MRRNGSATFTQNFDATVCSQSKVCTLFISNRTNTGDFPLISEKANCIDLTPSPAAYYVFSSTGWLEWLFFLAAFPGSYVLALARNRYGSKRMGDEALLSQ